VRGRLALLVAALVLLTGTGAAAAAAGDGATNPGAGAAGSGGLSFVGCVALHGDACKRSPVALDGATSVAVSRDGRSVYVSAFASGTVAGFSRDAGGSLRPSSCIAEAAVAGCATAPAGTLTGAAGLALSPSGADLYLATAEADGVVRLSRGDGALAFGSCTGAAAGCLAPSVGATTGGATGTSGSSAAAGTSTGSSATVGANPLAGATGIALGPGGSDVYVAALEAGAVTWLSRAADGSLAPRGCLAFGRSYGCKGVPGASLVGADAIAISPDGRNVYVASFTSAAVIELRRRPSGALVYRGCIAEGGADRCRKLPKGSLAGASGLAVSPRGDAVYVASQTGAVTRFRRSPHGRLSFASCLADGGLGGCAKAPGAVLKGATGIAVAPNGSDLYLAAQQADAIVHLRAGAGALRVAGCVATRRAGCDRAPGAALRGPYGIAVAADGRSVYGSSVGGALSAFARR
jgi:DNA-binding beta-propeller fold protein YncE